MEYMVIRRCFENESVKNAHNLGLEDCWRMVQWLMTTNREGGPTDCDLYSIFGTANLPTGITRTGVHKVKDAVEAIFDPQIQLGDMVSFRDYDCTSWSDVGVVVGIDDDFYDIMDEDGFVLYFPRENLRPIRNSNVGILLAQAKSAITRVKEAINSTAEEEKKRSKTTK